MGDQSLRRHPPPLLPVPRAPHTVRHRHPRPFFHVVHPSSSRPSPGPFSVHISLTYECWQLVRSDHVSEVAQFLLFTTSSSRRSGISSSSMDSFVLNSRQLTLSILLYVVISNADILLLSSTLSVQISQPYSATGHTSDPMSLSFNPVPMVLSFHSAVKDPMTVRAIPSLALISLPPSPFSSTMAPR